jgi:hypothetical protein
MSILGWSLPRSCLVVPIHELPRIFLAMLHNHSLLYNAPNYSLNSRSGLFSGTVKMPSCTLHFPSIITCLQYCIRVYLWTRKTDPYVVSLRHIKKTQSCDQISVSTHAVVIYICVYIYICIYFFRNTVQVCDENFNKQTDLIHRDLLPFYLTLWSTMVLASKEVTILPT